MKIITRGYGEGAHQIATQGYGESAAVAVVPEPPAVGGGGIARPFIERIPVRKRPRRVSARIPLLVRLDTPARLARRVRFASPVVAELEAMLGARALELVARLGMGAHIAPRFAPLAFAARFRLLVESAADLRILGLDLEAELLDEDLAE